MTSSEEIIVVSGLPRSGTSLMMQMLQGGGIEVVTDRLREADTDNPHGYLEYEAVKDLDQDASWLPTIRGKAVKIVSMLLYKLPPTERYRILFMERDIEEVLNSQEAMLKRLGRAAAPRDKMAEAFRIHLENLEEWLKGRSDMTLLRVKYRDLVQQPETEANRVTEFLGRRLDVDQMVQSVDPNLYRNRS